MPRSPYITDPCSHHTRVLTRYSNSTLFSIISVYKPPRLKLVIKWRWMNRAVIVDCNVNNAWSQNIVPSLCEELSEFASFFIRLDQVLINLQPSVICNTGAACTPRMLSTDIVLIKNVSSKLASSSGLFGCYICLQQAGNDVHGLCLCLSL